MALNLKKRPKETVDVPTQVSSSEHATGPHLQVIKQEGESSLASRERKKASDDGIKRKLKAYHQINELIQNAGGNLNVLIRDFLELAVAVLEAGGGSIWLPNKDKTEFTCQMATGQGIKEMTGTRVPYGTGIVGWVAEKKKGTIIKDVAKDARASKDAITDVPSQTRSLIVSPLLHRGELIGVVEILDRKSGEDFNQAELSFLNSLCVPAALHIETSTVLSNQRQLITRLDAIKNLQEVFSSTMELEPLLQLVMKNALDLLKAEVGSVWLIEDSGEGIVCWVAEGPTKDKVIGAKVKRGSGIIGWVVENSKPSIVEDCSKDARFSAALDKKIGFVTRSMVSAPLSVKGECIGAIQIINKRDPTVLFNQEDLDFLQLFAANATMYIKNARLFAAEKKAKELSALLKISSEITSTLDIDAVLMSVVNLSSDVIPYDRSVMSTVKRGTVSDLAVRAISGQERIDNENTNTQRLNELHKVCSQMKDDILVLSRADLEKSELPSALKDYLQNYLQNHELESFWACTLKDDQGTLGVFSMEAKAPGLIPESKRELLSILVNQSTVALRNADLYSTIPNSKMVDSFRQRLFTTWANMKTWSPRKHALIWGATATALASLVVIRIPYTVAAAVEVVPLAVTYYAENQSKIKEVLVKEGQSVAAGTLLVRLDVAELAIQREEKQAQRLKVRSEMIRLMAEEKVADYKIKEAELQSLELEIERLERQIEKSEVRNTYPGTVISENLRDLVGKPISPGQEIIKLARLDSVIVEFKVPEDDVVFVKPEQEFKFKVFGHPQTTFGEGIHLRSVSGEGRQLSESDPQKFFIARAEVPNTEAALLRPGMTGRGKISAEEQALWYVLLEKPLRFIITKLYF